MGARSLFVLGTLGHAEQFFGDLLLFDWLRLLLALHFLEDGVLSCSLEVSPLRFLGDGVSSGFGGASRRDRLEVAVLAGCVRLLWALHLLADGVLS